MTKTAFRTRSLEEMVHDPAVGPARAYNAYYGGHGNLPEQKFPGEHYEVLGLEGLDEDVATYIKENCSR